MDINSKEFKEILLITHNEFRKHTNMWGQKKELEAICERTGIDKKTAKQALYDMEHPFGKYGEYKEGIYLELDEVADAVYRDFISGSYGKDKVKAICDIEERTGVGLKTAMDALDIRLNGITYSEKCKIEKQDRKEERREKFFDWCDEYSEKANTVRCPKCRSTSISYDTKKLSVGRAIVGNAVAGPTGAIIGGLSSKKGYAVCLNCGKRWKI